MGVNVATSIKNNINDVWEFLKSFVNVEIVIYIVLTLATSLLFGVGLIVAFITIFVLILVLDKISGINIVDKLKPFFLTISEAFSNYIRISIEPSDKWSIEFNRLRTEKQDDDKEDEDEDDKDDETESEEPTDANKEVFNISNNKFNYDTARAVCAAYGAKIANYDEIENSYNKGGEWCNYGWSEGQMALFPTQKDTFNALQKIKGSENNCGRPGINGGFMANQELKFGANCFGIKPKMTPKEEKLKDVHNDVYTSEKDIILEKKVEDIRKNIDKLVVAPFNRERWSRLI